MTPNLFVATQTLFQPQKWFKSSRSERPKRKTEHWDSPVPGIYEHIPGRGWYLIATDKDTPAGHDGSKTQDGGPVEAVDTEKPKVKEIVKMSPPVPVRYSKVLKRYLLAPDYEIRKKYGKIDDGRGKQIDVGFFRLDDGIAWVQCWDEEGEFIPGPYKLWCIDPGTKAFRHMLKGDDPNYVRSRANSFERGGETTERRRSQDSRSTQYRSGPESLRDGASLPSTRANSRAASRANSIRGLTPSNPTSNPTSKPGSQANSRRNSPKRSQGLPFEEARAALRKAQQQAEAQARDRADSSAESMRRGRTPASPIQVS
ncbi:hypothetical protein BS50DRAFT_404187 [Corynespora cassiicola Philippines]|uniref:Uncharacterized protein n=1 Tax=Corynespora cassiicola Philippines TaxID=1448308 RepID=A0A2T2NKP7_CORCC|nr:hypothetical protein BS50DRAFT_404187 [Corynespora cassiicola Philippines]